MVQLVLVYCLMSDAKSCVEKRPMTEFPMTAMSCMISAQPMAIDFLREHPRYQLSSFRCEIDKPVEKQA
jgi:hypothetical protein